MNPEEQAELNVSTRNLIHFKGFNGYRVNNEVFEFCSSDNVDTCCSRRACETQETGVIL